MDPALNTILVMTGMGIPPFSARGITETLTPIPGQQMRTVNGLLVDLTAPQFQKYSSKLSAHDQDPPALNGVWHGLILTVSCISELAYLTIGGSPARPVVAGSSRVDGLYTFYRPVLTMMVTGFDVSTEEWTAAVSWSIDLEEQ